MISIFLSLFFQAPLLHAETTRLEAIQVSSSDGYRAAGEEKSKRSFQSSALFSEALEQERGVDVQTSCAFCGSKRLSINGLKGEHTTVLVDGVQLFSSISSFYSLDSVAPLFVEDLDIYRGPGASGYRPEAIAGVVNIRTKDPFKDQNLLSLQLVDPSKFSGGLLFERRINESHAVLLGVDAVIQKATDLDHNQVSEVPFVDRLSLMLKSAHQVSEVHHLSLRLSHSQLAVLGGSTLKKKYKESFLSAEKSDFQDGDVRKDFVGNPRAITDQTDLSRTELVLKGEYEVDSDKQVVWSLGSAWQDQDSIYSHGFDYRLKDQLNVAEVSWDGSLNSEMNLKFGAQYKTQIVRSQSEQLFQVLSLTPDSFDFETKSLYSQLLWQAGEEMLITAALRFEEADVNWKHFERNLAEGIFVPRLMLNWQHSEQWKSQWTWGRGYRMPLSLFESQHGTTEHGFDIDLTKLEESETLSYGISSNRENDFFEFNIFRTELYNMAYGKEPAIEIEPLSYINSSQNYQIWLVDVSFGSRLTADLSWELIAEAFFLPVDYKNKLPVAATERRLKFAVDTQSDSWQYQGWIQYFAEQNLSDYGYDKHFNRLTGDFPDPEVGVDRKKQSSPGYALIGAEARRFVIQDMELRFAIDNLLNFTQYSVNDGPLVWAQHGEHYHLDNTHLWGPLRGRQISVDLRYYF